MRSSYEVYGIECGKGWEGLYLPLLDLCQHYGITVLQVKEKFGTLRFYASGERLPELDKLICAAESASGHTCEDCGEDGHTWARNDESGDLDTHSRMIPNATTGRSETSGWVRTLCSPCRKAWDAARRAEHAHYATDAEAKAASDAAFANRAALLKRLADK